MGLKVTEMTVAEVLDGDELIGIVQNGENRQATLSDVVLLTAGGSATAELIRDTIGSALTAGALITITPDDAGDIITIAVDTSGIDERARDAIGTALVAGICLTKTVDDAGNTITIDVDVASASDYQIGTETDNVLVPDTVWDAAIPVALNDSGGNIALDLSTGINFTMTMDGDYTLSNPTNGKPGQTGCIEFTQDGTGTQTLAYAANWKFAGGNDPTLSTAAGAKDLLFYQVLANGTSVFANLVKAIA